MNKIIIEETKNILNVDQFTETIYKNFIYLRDNPELMHSKLNIKKMLSLNDILCYLVYYNSNGKKQLVGYLVGEFKTINDSRYIFYISYIYIAPNFRNLKLGTLLLNKIIDKCKSLGTKFILLTCDVYDKKLMHFYSKFNFRPDPVLYSNGKKHTVLSLFL